MQATAIKIGMGVTPGYGNGVRGFVPSDLGTSLYAWWNADAIGSLALSGNQVVTWTDLVTGAAPTQAVSGSRPVYDATGFNGSPCVTFDGIDDFLRVDSTLGNIPNSSGFTMFGVVSQDALAADVTVRIAFNLGTSNGTRRYLSRAVVAAANRIRVGVDGSSATGTTGDFSGRHLIAGDIGAANTNAFYDTVADGTVAVAPATMSGRILIGSIQTGAGNFWTGKIRDIVVVSSSISGAQLTALNTYLLARRNP